MKNIYPITEALSFNETKNEQKVPVYKRANRKVSKFNITR